VIIFQPCSLIDSFFWRCFDPRRAPSFPSLFADREVADPFAVVSVIPGIWIVMPDGVEVAYELDSISAARIQADFGMLAGKNFVIAGLNSARGIGLVRETISKTMYTTNVVLFKAPASADVGFRFVHETPVRNGYRRIIWGYLVRTV
jgi:hypothetical protein